MIERYLPALGIWIWCFDQVLVSNITRGGCRQPRILHRGIFDHHNYWASRFYRPLVCIIQRLNSCLDGTLQETLRDSTVCQHSLSWYCFQRPAFKSIWKRFRRYVGENISKDDKQAQIFSDRHRQQPFGQLWKKHHLWFIGCDNFGHCQCCWRTSVYPCGGNPWSHLLERYADIFQARMTRYLTYTALCSRQGLLLLKIIHTTRIELKCYIGIWSNLPGYATSRLVEWHQHRLFSCSSFYRFGHTLSALLYLWGDYFWSSDHPSLWRFFEIFEGYVTMRRHRASISLFRS